MTYKNDNSQLKNQAGRDLNKRLDILEWMRSLSAGARHRQSFEKFKVYSVELSKADKYFQTSQRGNAAFYANIRKIT